MKKTAILLPLMFLAPCYVQAGYVQAGNDLNYTFVELNYINLDIDDYNDHKTLIHDINDGNGWGVRGAYGFSDHIFVFAGYSSTQSDVDVIDDFGQQLSAGTDIDRFELGVGYHLPMTEKTDLVFSRWREIY